MAVKAGYNIDLRPGGEVYYSDNMINQFKNGLIPEYSKGMILVEFPMNEIPRYAEKSFFELALAGAELILAHPERNQGISRDIKKAAMFVEKGIILLVNAGSITGSYGPQVQDCAFQLLDMGLVTAVASDSHRGRGFSKLPEARDIVVDKYGQNAGFKLFHYNPDMIIKGKPVYPFKKNAADDKKSTTANTTLKKSFLKSIFNFFR
jgi:protein-tyrosine phosphatase